ncbi:MAG: M10 family metallopeptidase C-terminal domain-containing protein, partial [Hyphomicrobiales bacterium]
MALNSLSDEQVIAQLDYGYHWQGQSWTYSFPSNAWGSGGEHSGFSPLTAAQQATAHLTVQLWDDLIQPDIAFNANAIGYETNIEFANTTTGPNYAWAYFPGGGSVWLNPNYASGTNDLMTPEIGDHGFATYIHEIGHALGLNHMGDYGSSPAPQSYEDSTVYSVMSYFGPSWGSGESNGEGQVAWADWIGSDGQRHSPQTPMVNDIMAIQSMYGVETTTRTGDTVYGFNSNITDQTAQIFNFANNTQPILTIFDSAGNDTLDLSGWNTESYITLEPGAYSSANMMTYNIAIAHTAIIENAISGGGNDTIVGNEAANFLSGGGGNDELSGGAGNDRLAGGEGNDVLVGGAGTADFAVFAIVYSDANVIYDQASDTFYISGVSIGENTVSGIEYFEFIDVTLGASEFTGPGPTDRTVSISSEMSSVVEGNDGTTAFTFVVSLNEGASSATSVAYIVEGAGPNGANGVDFASAMTGVVEFAAGETSKTVTLQIAGDTVVEEDEGFLVRLAEPSSGLVLGTSTIDATITNDDAETVPDPIATGDHLELTESEASGDTDGNVLANDGGITQVHAVAGSTSGVGQMMAGSDGGMFKIMSDGSIDFDAGGQFEALSEGESITTSISYTVMAPAPASAGPADNVVPSEGVSIVVIDVNPRDFLPRTGNFTATEQVSGALNDGVITITDTQDLTFSDDNNGRESARSSGEVNGQSWTNITTDNEYQWVLRHPENGEEITVFQVHVEGSIGDYFWGATGELQAGVTYQVTSYNSNPNASQGVPYDEMVLAGTSGGEGLIESTATVTVTVMGENDAPDTVIDTYTTTQNVPLTGLDVLANDSDPEGDALSIGDIISTAHGTTTVSENGTLNYTPNEGYTGEDVITYIVADEHGATSEAHAYINVESPPDRTVSISSEMSSVVEGNDGTTAFTFVVSLNEG